MTSLTAKFSILDRMSENIANIAQAGISMVEQFERGENTVSAAFDNISSTAVSTSSTVDSVATSVSGLQIAADNASSTADTLVDALNNYGGAAAEATSQTDYWTSAVGNYDRSVLEAIYSTEELVDMGYKSADALREQEQMFELCEKSAGYLNKSIEATTSIEEELSKAIETAADVTDKLTNSEDISAETKSALAKASVEAAEAMNTLAAAQDEAAAAMEAYDAVMNSGTANLAELEAAAERAGHAAEALAEANGKATDATEELSKATENASEEAKASSKNGLDAIESIAGALASAGITSKVTEIAGAVYDLATAFSEAESTVVKATGASGEALDGLTTSMMNAYAASKSGNLGDTAAAVGEINTRMALTGDELTTVTGQFLDFSEITGTNVVGSVQNVTKIMNKWGIEGSNVESVLDKLAYAGQISGASIDSLSSTVINSSSTFQSLDMDLDNAIGLLADLELYGTSSQTAVTGLRTAVNNFSKDGLDAGEALRNVIEEIANMEDASEATALAVETFGSRAGQELAGAIRSGAISVDSLSQSLDVAQGTLKATATTAQTLDQKWTQASNNISSAFTKAVQPTIDGISSGFADIANGIGTFLNENPTLTKAITAIGIGIGVVVAGVAGVTFVTTVAIPALTAFGAALNTALGPIGWVALAIAGIVAAGTALVAMMSDTEDETAGMTATTKAQYYQLQDLNAEYEAACKQYGETSEEASRLKYQLDDLSEAFEANRQTVEEFTAEVDALCEAAAKVSSDFNDSLSAIKSSETGSLALIQKYEDLATQSNLTGAQEKELASITKKLAESYPDLAAQMDGATISAENYAEAMRRACQEEAEEQRQQQAQDTYVDALMKRAELTEEIAKAEENLRLSEASDENAAFLSDAWFYQKTGWLGTWATDTDEYRDALEKLNAAMEENEATIAQIEQGWESISAAEEAAAEQTVSWQEAVSTAYEGVKDKIEELCAAYDEAYQSALESFEGQFGLFDEASTQSEEYMNSTVENAQKALESQLAYWDNYLENIETLKSVSAGQLGITQENYEALMAYAQDGSEQAAGLAASMAEAIKNGDTEAVATLANTVGEVSAKQEEIAAATADWETNFTTEMKKIEREMQMTVRNLNLSDEAAASASSTIKEYANQIREGKAGAVEAAKEVADAVAAALINADASIDVETSTAVSVPGHANGTTNAESAFVAGENGPELVARPVSAYATGTTDSADYFIAGEKGPELIVGQQGSTVFPTEETDRLISALNNTQTPATTVKRVPLQVLPSPDTRNDSEKAPKEQKKHIVLEVAGSGAIEVGGNGGADKETILEVLYDHLKPVLMNIIQSEIYEEGDLSYEY